MSATFVTLWGYPLSWLEAAGTATGLLAVWLAARNNILNWPLGLVNVACFAVLFYQNQLYADVLLHVYFFVMGCYGWYFWRRQLALRQSIRRMHRTRFVQLCIICGGVSFVCAWGMANIHLWWPAVFPQPAAYPVADSFITVYSVAANVLMARYVVQNWLLWIGVDLLAPVVYYQRGIYFVAAEFVIFLVLAILGYLHWQKLVNAGRK